jgi:hypothetical protein
LALKIFKRSEFDVLNNCAKRVPVACGL